MNKTEAYIKAYDHNGTRKTANEEASRTTSLPQVKLELAKYSNIAEDKMIQILDYSTEYGRDNTKEGASYAAVAVTVAKDILDRVHGKATQRIEQSSQSVTISIDLTGVE